MEDRIINNEFGKVLLVNLDLVPLIALKNRIHWQGLMAASPV